MDDLRTNSRCRLLIIVLSVRLLYLVLFLGSFVDFFVDLCNTLTLDGLNIFAAAVETRILGQPFGDGNRFLVE